MSVDEIVSVVKKHPTQHVCVTGGEPLLQPEVGGLVTTLCDLGYSVSIETSGDLDATKVDQRVWNVIDIKTPDSGEFGKFSIENLKMEPERAEFKFVICSEKDFYWAESFAKENKLFGKFNVLYSPSFHQIEPRWLAEKIISEKSAARLQLQLHKYIWSPHQRGV